MKKMKSILLKHNKQGRETETVIMPNPSELIIPISQHIGAPLNELVSVGDRLEKGQVIASSPAPVSAPFHAPLSGVVKEIYDFVMPNGTRTRAIRILTEEGEEPAYEKPLIETKEQFLSFVKEIGAVGLGGAAFPTHIKLNPPVEVDTLIVNAAECEPFLTSDERGIIEDPDSIIRGISAILKFTDVKRAFIAVENNKPEAISILKEKVKNEENIFVKVLKPTYPQGAEKVIIYNVAGRIVPEGKLPMDAGVIVINVSTAGLIGASLVSGAPLTHKRITIAGDSIKTPVNVLVPVGTKIRDIVEFLGGYVKEPRKILLGGPMMGTAVYTDEFPVLKNTNGILFLSEDEVLLPEETACIRCGKCVDGCPLNLSPVALYNAFLERDFETLEKEHIMLCMECGSCAYVCPAARPLTQSHRLSKAEIRRRGKK